MTFRRGRRANLRASGDAGRSRGVGFVLIRAVIKLALVALVVHAAVKTVPVFWNYAKFRDAVEETARFSSKRSEQEVKSRVMAIAGRLDIPLVAEELAVRKVEDRTIVEAAYTADLSTFPAVGTPGFFVPHRRRGTRRPHALTAPAGRQARAAPAVRLPSKRKAALAWVSAPPQGARVSCGSSAGKRGRPPTNLAGDRQRRQHADVRDTR